MRYVIVAVLAMLLGGGLEYERGRVHYAYELGNAYGCGLLAEQDASLGGGLGYARATVVRSISQVVGGVVDGTRVFQSRAELRRWLGYSRPTRLRTRLARRAV